MNLKRQGAFVAGRRPGKPTEDYLAEIIHHVSLWGNAWMVLLIMIITAICNISGVGSLSLSGTSLIIAVSVMYDLYVRIIGENKVRKVSTGKKRTVLNH